MQDSGFTMKARNEFKTSDIQISKDSVGCYTATHKFQGVLIDGNFYNDRAECRRDAVKVLSEIKSHIMNEQLDKALAFDPIAEAERVTRKNSHDDP